MENVKENYGRNESEILGSYMNSCEGDAQARGMADAVARRSYGKLVAFLAARAGDVAAAEDALSDAFVSALTDWPQNGCPSNPEAWLLTVARRKMIDLARRRRYSEVATERLNLLAEGLDAAATGAEIPDRRLALMFSCAHPAIESGIRAPLILQVVVGLDAKIIASAFLTSPAAMGKRLVRSKSKIRQAGIPFSVPEREELPGRLDRPWRDRYCPPRPHRGSVISVQARGRFAAGGAGGSGAAGSHASRGSPASRATQRGRRIRSACRSRYGAVGLGDDR